MELIKTEKTEFSSEDILKFIANYEMLQVKEFDKLWEYYRGNNVKIMTRRPPDENTPDNKVPIPYGRKIVTTFTGYAYRPRYISYKPVESEEETERKRVVKEEGKIAKAVFPIPIPGEPKLVKEIKAMPTLEKLFAAELQDTFDKNNEHIKTARAGRNTGVFGVSYELLYIKGTVNPEEKVNGKFPVKAEVRFFSVDPRELILLYDFSSEPEKVAAIRYYRITTDHYKVEVYWPDKVELYDRKRSESAAMDKQWQLISKGTTTNFFGEIPVVPYYFGDEMSGVIEPVLPLINAYDTLMSDSLNEFDRFAYAYLIMKRFGITDPTKKKEPGVISKILRELKRRRVFENVPADGDISFLTKDIPTDFIKFMADWIREQIHIQSHVPDFTSERMSSSGLSGIAVQRLLFDFENLVSSSEADFDVGLVERIRLITIIYEKSRVIMGALPDMISINHKRNTPLNLKEFADTAKIMKETGFSSWLVADIMPDDIIPNVDEELERQEDESLARMPDIDQFQEKEEEDGEESDDDNQFEE